MAETVPQELRPCQVVEHVEGDKADGSAVSEGCTEWPWRLLQIAPGSACPRRHGSLKVKHFGGKTRQKPYVRTDMVFVAREQ